MTDKILADPFYGDLYQEFGAAFVEEAGYFADNRKPTELLDYALNIPCTPISSWVDQIKDAANPCVILSTGSFCPVHQGHLDMMVEAKKGVERLGYTVLQGYLSPGHDEYIFSKKKHSAIPVHQRLALLEQAIHPYDWMSIDPWEGLFTTVAVNFTEVVHRLTRYIEHFTGQSIPVFFLCGGDNARFSLTFKQKGHCVVAGRPGYQDRYEHYKSQTAPLSDRIIWVEGHNATSSTQLNTPYLPPAKKALSIRLQDQDPDDRAFEKSLMEGLKARFTKIRTRQVSNPALPGDLPASRDYISLDPFVEAGYNLSLSRHYDAFGTKKLGYGQRPFAPPLAGQLRAMPRTKALALYDDDICSGQTMAFARQLLNEHGIDVSGTFSQEKSGGENIEILDSRDFLLGAHAGGLVVRLPNGQLCRMPYVYPYVCPFQRASVPDPMPFSLEVWELNRQYYQVRQSRLVDHPRLHFLLTVGFQPSDTLEWVSQWHTNWLSRFLC